MIPFSLSSGTAGSPVQFNSTDVPKAIPDLSTVDSLLTVSGVTAAVARVTVTLYLTHTYDSDLNISLIGPDSTTVLLSSANGANGDNYGTSCGERRLWALRRNVSSAAGAGALPRQERERGKWDLAVASWRHGGDGCRHDPMLVDQHFTVDVHRRRRAMRQ
jgi:hypothetical protein